MNETNKVIPPTVGRQVHFHLASADVSHISGWVTTQDNTYAATVSLVHHDRLVNLAVYDGSGYLYPMQSIPLCQPGDERPLGNWCEWPAHTAAMSRPPGRVPIVPPAGDPPTLSNPYKPDAWRSEKIGDSIETHERRLQDHVSMEREAQSRRAEETRANDLIRHPVIGAVQELDNDGNVIPKASHTAYDRADSERRSAEDDPPPTIPQD